MEAGSRRRKNVYTQGLRLGEWLMVSVEFRDDNVLMVRLSGAVTAMDVDRGWSALADPSFSAEHDVIVDASWASIGFSAADIPPIVSNRDQLPPNANGITCIVVKSHLAAAVVGVVSSLVMRDTRWQVVSDLDTAYERIHHRRQP